MCVRPNIIYSYGTKNEKTGKLIYKFSRYTPELLRTLESSHLAKVFLVPCGQCFECRKRYSKQWTVRLINELQTSENAYFLTITYNDEHLPDDTFRCKPDIQLFFKSLKQHFKTKKIRYFACYEMGETTLRPHFHAIVYNLPLDDLTLFWDNNGELVRQYSKSGEPLGHSPTLDKLWNKGFIQIGDVNYQTASYVAGYVQKKCNEDLTLYDKKHLARPFTIMSKGLGFTYFNQNKETLLKSDEIFYCVGQKVRKSSIPRYYEKLLEKGDKLALYELKMARNSFADDFKHNLASTSDAEQKIYFRSKRRTDDIKSKKFVRGF